MVIKDDTRGTFITLFRGALSKPSEGIIIGNKKLDNHFFALVGLEIFNFEGVQDL